VGLTTIIFTHTVQDL